MRKQTASLLITLGVLFAPTWLWAAPLVSRILSNDGAIFEVQVGTYGELSSDPESANADRTVLALDVTRPDKLAERHLLPATLGVEVEASPVLIYSKEADIVNVIWESYAGGEVSLLNTQFIDQEWSATVDELYFHPEGVRPLLALTHDELHMDLEDSSVDVERQILHLVWPQNNHDLITLAYSPLIILNGNYIGVRETLSLPHLNANPNETSHHAELIPSTFQVAIQDEDLDRITLTFGSSISQRITAYNIDVLSMDIVHFGHIIRDFVLASDLDPQDLASFADKLGIHIVGVGARRNLRSRSLLTPSVIDYVAAGTVQWILDYGSNYGQASEIAADIAQNAMYLAQSLHSPASVARASKSFSPSSSQGWRSKSTLVIDIGELVEGDPSNVVPSHILDLRFAVELPVPDSNGSEITLFSSDSGERFLAVWRDSEDEDVLKYVESQRDGTWSEPQALGLSEKYSLAQAFDLLKQRVQ